MTTQLSFPHPGVLLRQEFLDPLKITPYRLARAIGVPPTRIAEILAGRRSVTAETGLLLDRYFGLSEGYWLGLQHDYDLRKARQSLGAKLGAVKPLAAVAA
jgi:addiction module HigA family antidote